MDDSLETIKNLAATRDRLARKAELLYAEAVDAVIEGPFRDSQSIERLLDGLLDFCFDPAILLLYKKLCRYYFGIDPHATVDYVNAYREMWDSEESGE
jgi:hypothetical protein